MQNIVELASTYKLDVEMRAFAHYVSSNDHRRKGVRWGVAAAILGGAAGLSTLAGASRLDSLKDALSHFGVSWSVFLVVLGVVFLISSIVSGVMHFLQHPEQARTHMASYAGYFRIKQRLEIFRLWYDDRNGTSPDKVQALKDLEEICKDIENVAAKSIYPVEDAFKEGRKTKDWLKDFGNSF